ncbi:Protein phosphatase 2C (PP2C)-like domain [Macleaya cordata]|uniref:Protein phosphatase 2C (PP2C)-like domain n=1 Tax=Macleaya cordata TaxID=56857 RepID=A0A200Q1E8_MACCD|nr:Protein phosphatase 2C (PP2C)-like domain [Macleaya cordata]
MLGETIVEPAGELQVTFGYQCNDTQENSYEVSDGYKIPYGHNFRRKSSFSFLSGAALSANTTLANTNMCNGLIGAGILPSLDSPKSFRRVPSSPSFARLDILSSSLQSGLSTLSSSLSSQSEFSEWDSYRLKSMSAPSKNESFLNAKEVEVAGGAAGEDRVQAVCSEENGWLFCAIYDGFNGRDAADFLAGTLYETIGLYLNLLDKELKEESNMTSDDSLLYFMDESNFRFEEKIPSRIFDSKDKRFTNTEAPTVNNQEISYNSFRHKVLDSLQYALNQAESEFLCMVEQEMEDRPDLVSVGSCVLVVLIYDKDLYILNLGDSRAVLATYVVNDMDETVELEAIQLSDIHSVDNEVEQNQLLSDHPDDPSTIVAGRVKGKLKLTRAFGVGYLKKRKMNEALMGILQVRNLLSPPYISTQPSLNVHRISKEDCFVVIGSDGLFDFISNDEAVKLVHSYILSNPSGDPAKFLLEQLLLRAADSAGFSTEELMRIPAGRRRKYHDDVTVIVVILGSNLRTSKASTVL